MPASLGVTSCSVDGCEKPGPFKRGMCAMHYRRFQLYGDPTERSPKYSNLTCSECGADIVIPDDQIGNAKMTCSDKCTYARSHRVSQGRYSGFDPRKLTGFAREDVFRRDNWVCQLCNKPVDRDLDHKHKMSATLDHIIPRSIGGGDSIDNLRLAHRSCNSRRRADDRG